MENSSLFKFVLILLLALVGYTVYRTEVANKEIALLKEQIAILQDGETIPQPETTPKQEPQPEKRSGLQSLFKKDGSASGKNERKKNIQVSAKLKLENRYAEYGIKLPKVVGNETGTVGVKITVKQVGDVIAASIDTEKTTIIDQDVREACKEAALRTDISINWDAPQKQAGTIIYTFE